MLHGAGGSIEVWFRQVPDFARYFNLLLVDLAGHGESVDDKVCHCLSFDKVADQVMEVVIPTLYLMGENDHLFLEQAQLDVANSCGNVSMVVVPNAGHVCNIDNKSFFNRVSIDFFSKIS